MVSFKIVKRVYRFYLLDFYLISLSVLRLTYDMRLNQPKHSRNSKILFFQQMLNFVWLFVSLQNFCLVSFITG